MGLSVTRTIWLRDDVLEVARSKVYLSKWEALEFIKRMPRGECYNVTYTLDEKGPLLVVKKRIMIVINVKTKEDMGVCFLPKSWDGKNVRRKITVPIYEM